MRYGVMAMSKKVWMIFVAACLLASTGSALGAAEYKHSGCAKAAKLEFPNDHAARFPQPMPGVATKVQVGPVQDVGWRRRYWRYGYTAPYAYYPPAYGYYYPPPAY